MAPTSSRLTWQLAMLVLALGSGAEGTCGIGGEQSNQPQQRFALMKSPCPVSRAAGAPPPAAAINTNTSGPLCAGLSPDGRKVLGALTQAPTADDICAWVTQYLPDDPLHLINTCDKLAVVETSLTKASNRTPACDPDSPFQVLAPPASVAVPRPVRAPTVWPTCDVSTGSPVATGCGGGCCCRSAQLQGPPDAS
jgi:hypothetical protein